MTDDLGGELYTLMLNIGNSDDYNGFKVSNGRLYFEDMLVCKSVIDENGTRVSGYYKDQPETVMDILKHIYKQEKAIDDDKRKRLDLAAHSIISKGEENAIKKRI